MWNIITQVISYVASFTPSVSASVTPENLIVVNLSLRLQIDSPKLQIFLGSFIENQILSKILREEEIFFYYLCITRNISELIIELIKDIRYKSSNQFDKYMC